MTNTNLPKKILIIDDDPGDLKSLENIIAGQKINVVCAKDWSSALYQFNTQKFDLVIVELELDEMLGTALIQKWRSHEVESKRDCAYILSTGMNRSARDDALILEIGDVGKIAKPFKLPTVLGALGKAMAVNNQRVKIISVKEKLIDPLIKQKKFDKAVGVADEKLMPINNKGKHLAAKVYEEAGELTQALEIVTGLSQAESNNMAYINDVGRLNMLLGDNAAAKKAFETADKIAPMNISRLNDMATLYLEMKEPENSINKFRQILDLTPENQEIKFDMYQRLMNAGYQEQAQKFCRETSTPIELIRHYNNKGVVFSKESDYVSAIDEYKKALKLIPKAKEIYRIKYNMAIAHINLKHYDHIVTAHGLLKECLELKPDYDKARKKLEITERHLEKKPA